MQTAVNDVMFQHQMSKEQYLYAIICDSLWKLNHLLKGLKVTGSFWQGHAFPLLTKEGKKQQLVAEQSCAEQQTETEQNVPRKRPLSPTTANKPAQEASKKAKVYLVNCLYAANLY